MFENEKKRLRQRLERRVRQADVEERFLFNDRRHSKAYHRFFEGYSEYSVLEKNGKAKIHRVYTGRLYVQRLTRGQRSALKFGYVLLLFAAFVLFGSAVVTDVACNYFWYVSVAGAIVFFGLLWMIPALVTYLPTSGELKISEYRSGAKVLRNAALLCAAAAAATSVLAALAVCLNRLPFSKDTIAYLTKLLFSAALFFVVNQLETHVPYDIRNGTAEAPEEAVEIS